jgi:hypothetical protein
VAAVAESPNLRQALTYARHGWRVFPAIPGEKVPATAHGVHDATSDLRQIRAWWERNPGRNVAIACGEPGPDVLDIDRKPDGSGFPVLGRLHAAGLVPTPRAYVRTPNDGLHLYFAPTPGAGNGSVPAAHIDHRGEGGYVIAPPSQVRRAADGQLRPYAVVEHGPSTERIDWTAIRQFLDPQPERSWIPPPHLREGGRQNLDHLVEHMAGLDDGRKRYLFWAACRILDHGQPERLEDLARAAAAAGSEPRQIGRTIESARRQGRQDPHTRPQPRGGPMRISEPGPARAPQPDSPHEPQRTAVAVLAVDRDSPGVPSAPGSARAPARLREAGEAPVRDATAEPGAGRSEQPGGGGAERQAQPGREPEREAPVRPFAHPGIEQPEREAGE